MGAASARRSARAEGPLDGPFGSGAHAPGFGRPLVIEGEVVRDEPVRDDRP